MRDAFRFGEWLVEPDLNRLSRGGESTRIEPLSMDVLIHLLTHKDRVVSADELLDQIWPDRHADPGMVKKRIGQIRRAIGDDAKEPAYIETIPKRGYRAIAPVFAIQTPAGTSSPLIIASGRPARRWWVVVAMGLGIVLAVSVWVAPRPPSPALDLSVVVAPLVVLGDDSRLEDYAAGLKQEMQGILTAYPELRTLSKPQSDSLESAASYEVKGSVQSRGADLRLRIRLMRTPDAESVWSTTFEGGLDESTSEMTRVATAVSRFVRLELVKDYQCEKVKRESRSKEAAALVCGAQAEHYAVQQGGTFDARAMVRSARRAISLEPQLPEAYFFLAMGLNLLHGIGSAELDEVEEEAYTALSEGLALDPENALLLWARGEAEVQFDLNYDAAEASFRRALAVDPMNPNARSFHESLAMLAMRRGGIEEALEHYHRALSLYDSDVHVYEGYAYTLLCAGHPRDAIRAADQGLDLVSSGGFRSSMLATKARAHVAMSEHSQATAILDSLPVTVDVVEQSLFVAPMLAVGRGQEARELVSKLESHPNPFSYAMAMAYAALGQPEQSFKWLQRGIEERLPMTMMYVRFDPAFERMRIRAEWSSIVRLLNTHTARI